MRLAVFSDIHGNLEALEAFIHDAAGRRVDAYICLGDVVGYGANPNECVDLVRSVTGEVVLGVGSGGTGSASPRRLDSTRRRMAWRWSASSTTPVSQPPLARHRHPTLTGRSTR